jgi:hypothetical protein
MRFGSASISPIFGSHLMRIGTSVSRALEAAICTLSLIVA